MSVESRRPPRDDERSVRLELGVITVCLAFGVCGPAASDRDRRVGASGHGAAPYRQATRPHVLRPGVGQPEPYG